MAVFGIAAAFIWAGCALVIDLGDEPKALASDASSVFDSAPADAGDGAVEEYTCGLPPLVDPACRACSESRCCTQIEKCSTADGCPEGVTCIQDCLAQFGCILECLDDYSVKHDASTLLKDVVDCSSLECAECTPKPQCQKLGACATLLDPDAGAILRQTARSAILELNEGNCDGWREVIRKEIEKIQPDVDAAVCY